MRRPLLLIGALLLGACNLPPEDPFAAAERALRRNDLLQALQAYDAVPVKHERYPDARAAAGDVEQRMRRCHELILEALMLRAEWRDSEALTALRRAVDHWPGQPSLGLWIRATQQRLRLFGDRDGVAAATNETVPATPLIELAPAPADRKVGATDVGPSAQGDSQGTPVPSPVQVPSRAPLPMVPIQTTQAVDPAAKASATSAGDRQEAPGDPAGVAQQVHEPGLRRVAPKPVPATPIGEPATNRPTGPEVPAAPDRTAAKAPRVPLANDPVALGLVSAEASLGRSELAVALRDLIELARRFPGDVRVNRRLSRLLHQRALMHYGSGAVAAAVADWRRVLELDAGNDKVRRLLQRALAESVPKSKRGK